jgi:ABC-type multidrug transport system ATPase subunit
MNISIKNLTKIYKGGFKALDNVNLEIKSGIFGLLGPNGAGKTTLIRILATLLETSTGDIKIGSYDIYKNRKKIRKMLGYLPQEFNTFPQLNAFEFLDYIASLNGMRKGRKDEVERVLKATNLTDVAERRIKTFSGGMVRRLGIAQALLGNPHLLIVDEPTTGLDPEERIRFRTLLSEISEERVVILSTHIVGDISAACTDMALLNLGKLAYHGPPDEFIKYAEDKVWVITATEQELDRIKEQYTIVSLILKEDGVDMRVTADKKPEYDCRSEEPNLEDAYIYFMESVLGTALAEEELAVQ